MILIVQPCTMYLRHIKESLETTGAKIRCANSYAAACELLQMYSADLVLSDVELGEQSGFELCRHLRQLALPSALILVSDKSSPADRVLALEMGADDFICYPCTTRELQARVAVQLRHVAEKKTHRVTDALQTPEIRCGCITIDDARHQVWVMGQPVCLTATEYSLLRYLALHPEQVFSRLQLLEAVWGYQHSGYEHTVVSHINRLRSKFTQGAQTRIATVWGVGYKLSSQVTPARLSPTANVTPLRQPNQRIKS